LGHGGPFLKTKCAPSQRKLLGRVSAAVEVPHLIGLAIFNDFVNMLDKYSEFALTLAVLDDWMEMRGISGFV
jgi:hypothetical protein